MEVGQRVKGEGEAGRSHLVVANQFPLSGLCFLGMHDLAIVCREVIWADAAIFLSTLRLSLLFQLLTKSMLFESREHLRDIGVDVLVDGG